VPFRAEVTALDLLSAHLLRTEIGEFKELVQQSPSSAVRSEVLDHIDHTRFIVASELPGL
jgi:hypothetical protein